MDRIGGGGAMRGSALLELTLGLGLLAAGALALAASQPERLRAAQRAGQYAAASQLLQNLAATVRANPGHWAAVAATDIVVRPQRATLLGARLAAGFDCRRQACRDGELAAYDLDVWGRELAARLPQSRGTVRCHGRAPQPCVLGLQWQDAASAPRRQLQLVVWR